METTNIILLKAAEGCKLYNEKDCACAMSVLITDGDTSAWREITDEEAEQIESRKQEKLKIQK